MARKYQQGIYEPVNKEKYTGTKNPTYRSSYELEVFKFFDRSPYVIKWSSELVVVPYFDPVKQKKRRYITDVYVEYRDKQGNKHIELIEIKPSSQCKPPVKGKRQSKHTYEEAMLTYMTNTAKWEHAAEYARQRGWKFRILTENQIFRG
ncbi:MAG: hypothetical protein CMF22_11740 [Idiomarinaceae bacterium]|nr:hypothetical protein [Idiomarinaceae bacterium]|tara:strand:- start:47800 stop:48246 length:447 start_codon:yes stop_codon:yes gene_type:complete